MNFAKILSEKVCEQVLVLDPSVLFHYRLGKRFSEIVLQEIHLNKHRRWGGDVDQSTREKNTNVWFHEIEVGTRIKRRWLRRDDATRGYAGSASLASTSTAWIVSQERLDALVANQTASCAVSSFSFFLCNQLVPPSLFHFGNSSSRRELRLLSACEAPALTGNTTIWYPELVSYLSIMFLVSQFFFEPLFSPPLIHTLFPVNALLTHGCNAFCPLIPKSISPDCYSTDWKMPF